ncbi:MAG TPA: hypothetical protein VES79_12640 [Solirubrobacteraceae bacterium]|nr:hypothetical protein [Solirubrobacteraceae bacterium]
MRARLLVAALAAAFLATAAPAWAGDPIMPLSQLRSGMQCTGYSVIRGTEIASFAVEILDVVSGDASAEEGPRLLVRVSGPAVDETGIGPGFSGSPIYCPDPDGTARNAGAISEAIGEFGGKVVLATPIEVILGNPPDAPAAKPVPARAGRARQLASPLTVSGLSLPLAKSLARAGQKAGRPLLAAPPAPLTPFPISPPRPGSAMSAGYSTGDLSVGAVGTVAYVDGDRVWGFGHPFENGGERSLLLQDAYVYRVINNPNSGDQGSTYKLAAVGHPLGTISNDASAAVVGRTGVPPPTVPVRIFSTDLDTGEQGTLGTRVVDETGVGTPTGGSALTFIAPLAVAQGASAILRSTPGKLTGTMCARIALRERRAPLRFCNRYVSGVAPPEDAGATNVVAAGAAADVLQALSLLDEFKLSALHVTEFAARVKLRRGQRQAFMRSVRLPRRVRPGQRVRARLSLRVVRGRRLTRSFTLRIPSLRPGRHRLTFSGTDLDNPDSEFFGALVSTITIGDEQDEAPTGDPGPGSVEELAARVRTIARFDGVSVRASGRRGRGDPAYLDPEVRISGRVSANVRVVRKGRER